VKAREERNEEREREGKILHTHQGLKLLTLSNMG
jgi:hypothetical protein